MNKRILIISNVPFYGGGEKFILSTLSYLEKYYDVSYLVADEELKHSLPSERTFTFSSSNLFKQFQQLRKIAKELSPDLLLFNGGSIFYFLPLLKSYKKILYRHSTNKSASMSGIYAVLMNVIYAFADLTIHVSNYSLSEQICFKKKAICIYNGIQLDEFQCVRKSSSNLKVLYCGRLESSKGIDIIISAFKEIPEEIATLYIVGSGSLEHHVKSSICDNIKYFGFRTNVDPFYNEADAFILMSDYENCPISILEAMNKSLPIITTGAGGISEMVNDHYNGLLIPKDKEAIKKAVLELKEQANECIRMGKNSRINCESNFNIEHKRVDIHNAIERILN